MRITHSKSQLSIFPYVLLGLCLGIGLTSFLQKSSSLLASTRKPGKAWTLVVTLQFESETDANQAIADWKVVADYCAKNEPFLYHYEIGKSDSDPLKLHIVERYESKEKYLNVHKSGSAFLEFRPKLKALQDAGKVTIEGFSYQELGQGFVM